MMVLKFMLAALLFEIQSVMILQRLIVFPQIPLLTSVFVLFRACLVSVCFEMHWRNYLHFAFLLQEAGKISSFVKA